MAPGTRVRYRELESGEEKEVLLLGPWDPSTILRSRGGQLSRPPRPGHAWVATPGDTCTMDLPGGGLDVLILEIHIEDLDNGREIRSQSKSSPILDIQSTGLAQRKLSQS